MQKNCVKVGDLAKCAFNAIVPAAVLRGLKTSWECDADVPRCIQTDEMRLRQVLLNILSNSVKFTEIGHINMRVHAEVTSDTALPAVPPSGPSVFSESNACGSANSSRVYSAPPCGSYDHSVVAGRKFASGTPIIVFSIEDTGIGLSTEFLDSRMYLPFEQGHHGFSRDYGGSGLGLNIALQLIEAMCGCIITRSTVGKGSMFEICVPATPCNRHSAPSVTSLDASTQDGEIEWQPTRALLAEDVPINQKIFVRMLKNAGCAEIDVASNGKDVLELVKSKGCAHYTIIFLDIEMPVMDGIEAIKELRRTPGCENEYVCALTAHALDSTKKFVDGYGFNDWIPKPATDEALRAAVQRALRHSREIHRAVSKCSTSDQFQSKMD